jgi:hypothetical protein
MKIQCKLLLLSVFALTFLNSCKKDSTIASKPDIKYFMKFRAIKFDGSSDSISCDICIQNEVIVNSRPQVSIDAVSTGKASFKITLIRDENNLKTGEIYNSDLSPSNNSYTFLNFTPTNNSNNGYGFSSYPDSFTTRVTLTEVTPDFIKGTFSGKVYLTSNNELQYTIVNGSFCSDHKTNRIVIP